MVGLGTQPASESTVLVTPAYRYTRFRSIPTPSLFLRLNDSPFPLAKKRNLLSSPL